MKRYVKSYDMSRFTKIRNNPNWATPVRDDKQPYRNLIPYAGNRISRKISDIFNSKCYIDWDMKEVDLQSLKSIQPYIFEEGLDSEHIGLSNEPCAVYYKGELYLINGNHRVVKSYLQGNQTMLMLVATIG